MQIKIIKLRKNIKMFLFSVLFININLNFGPSVFAAVLSGKPTFPIPFYNDAERGICFCNATLQCLLQCPKFCLFIDQIKEPNSELEIQLKMLRENLKRFTYDEELLWSFLNKPSKKFADPRISELRSQIINCSNSPCWEIFKYMNSNIQPRNWRLRFWRHHIAIRISFIKRIFRLRT
jgi:hypothetical protein